MNRRNLLKMLAAAPILPLVLPLVAQAEPTQTLVISDAGYTYEVDVPVRDHYEIEWLAYSEMKDTGEVLHCEVSIHGLGTLPMRKIQSRRPR